jgi:phosphatidylserine/phosphatidylglycerophosphate/cardiolipin synthase-like enzyme
MTGSHNLGFKASSANDDNLVIIEGNAALAAAYAINIVAIFQTYHWNSYVEAHRKDPQVWHGLVDNDRWQSGYLTGERLSELKFWLGEKTAGASAQAPAHTVVSRSAPQQTLKAPRVPARAAAARKTPPPGRTSTLSKKGKTRR